jgi:hypothetical protein
VFSPPDGWRHRIGWEILAVMRLRRVAWPPIRRERETMVLGGAIEHLHPHRAKPGAASAGARPPPSQISQRTCLPPITGTLPCLDQKATVFRPSQMGHSMVGGLAVLLEQITLMTIRLGAPRARQAGAKEPLGVDASADINGPPWDDLRSSEEHQFIRNAQFGVDGVNLWHSYSTVAVARLKRQGEDPDFRTEGALLRRTRSDRQQRIHAPR